jgi:hypothetical protein
MLGEKELLMYHTKDQKTLILSKNKLLRDHLALLNTVAFFFSAILESFFYHIVSSVERKRKDVQQ